MPRVSEEHFGETPTPKSSSKRRFSNIFKSSPRSSMSIAKEFFKAIFTKGDVQPSSPAGHDMTSEEISAPNAVDKTIDPSGGTNAEDMVKEWQAELGGEQAQNHEISTGVGLQSHASTFSSGSGSLSKEPVETPTGRPENPKESYIIETGAPAFEKHIEDTGVLIQVNSNDEHASDIPRDNVRDFAFDEHLTEADNPTDDHNSVITDHLVSQDLSHHNIINELYRQGVPTPEGVQFYVNRKIQEALQAHEEKFHKPIHLPRQPVALPTSLKLGPIYVTNPSQIMIARRMSAFIYMSALFCMALQGPKDFFLTVWFMAVYAGTYGIVAHELGWKDEQAPDMLLEPVYRGFDLMARMGEYATLRIGLLLVPSLVES